MLTIGEVRTVVGEVHTILGEVLTHRAQLGSRSGDDLSVPELESRYSISARSVMRNRIR